MTTEDLRALIERERVGPSAWEVLRAADVLRSVDLEHVKIEDLSPEQVAAVRVLMRAAETDERPGDES